MRGEQGDFGAILLDLGFEAVSRSFITGTAELTRLTRFGPLLLHVGIRGSVRCRHPQSTAGHDDRAARSALNHLQQADPASRARRKREQTGTDFWLNGSCFNSVVKGEASVKFLE